MCYYFDLKRKLKKNVCFLIFAIFFHCQFIVCFSFVSFEKSRWNQDPLLLLYPRVIISFIQSSKQMDQPRKSTLVNFLVFRCLIRRTFKITNFTIFVHWRRWVICDSQWNLLSIQMRHKRTVTVFEIRKIKVLVSLATNITHYGRVVFV